MRARPLVCTLLLVAMTPVNAGHGFMNSFGDVEWFPDPGITPNEWTYRLDRADEQLALMRASGENKFSLPLEYAEEKLSEASAMIKAKDPAAARIALDYYDDYITRANVALESSSGAEQAALRSRFIDAVLEHIYLITVDYVDMPLKDRTMLSKFFETGILRYEAARDKLPKAARDALFFKEEEVRWSIEMTRQADAQGIVN